MYNAVATIVKQTTSPLDLVTSWKDKVWGQWMDLLTEKPEEPYWYLNRKKCYKTNEAKEFVYNETDSVYVKNLTEVGYYLDQLNLEED